MKTFIHKLKILCFAFVSICVITSCNLETIDISEQFKIKKTERIGYDYEKDIYINQILDEDPIFIYKSIGELRSCTVIRYDQIEITVFHKETVPYETVEEWNIFARDKNGNQIMLQSPLDIPEHKVSDSTINRIKAMALALK